ncbi:hypothetical protein CPAV1605_850 [seawater metagenome]|uniref:Uncharacterized protein n=1 Tax=seawater metagenome TaxID=1561972 RepID=A0A5E8CLN7_9ZZZZ
MPIEILILGILILILILKKEPKQTKCLESFKNKEKTIMNKSELSLIGYISNENSKKKIYKFYSEKGVLYFVEKSDNTLVPIKKVKTGYKVIFPKEKPYNAEIFPEDFFTDEYAQLSKYKIEVPYYVDDYKYKGTLENQYITNTYYLYEKEINKNMRIFNYIVYQKQNNKKLKLISVFRNQNYWSLGDPVRIKIDKSGPYGLYLIAP